MINGNIAMSSQDGITCYFANLEPIFAHPDDDQISRRVIMGMLHEVNHISQKRLAEVFGVHRNTISSSAAQYRVGGFSSFHQKKSGRSRTVLIPKVIKQGSQLLAEGMSQRGAARVLGINWVTFHSGCKAGLIKAPLKPATSTESFETEKKPFKATVRSERNTKDQLPSLGRATHDVIDRQLAARGKLAAAKPIFDQAHKAVENGGVLTTLPLLLQEGLLYGINDNLKPSNGYYGMTSILNFSLFLLWLESGIQKLSAMKPRVNGELS